MAEENEDTDRSEDPTQKRLDDALERGDVAKSQEINTWFVLAGALLALFAFGEAGASGMRMSLRGLMSNMHAIRFDAGSLLRLAERLGMEMLAVLALPFLILALAAIAGNICNPPDRRRS